MNTEATIIRFPRTVTCPNEGCNAEFMSITKLAAHTRDYGVGMNADVDDRLTIERARELGLCIPLNIRRGNIKDARKTPRAPGEGGRWHPSMGRR